MTVGWSHGQSLRRVAQGGIEDFSQRLGTLGRRNVSENAIRRSREKGRESIETHSHMGRINPVGAGGRVRIQLESHGSGKEVNLSLDSVLNQVKVVQDVTCQGKVSRNGRETGEVAKDELIDASSMRLGKGGRKSARDAPTSVGV